MVVTTTRSRNSRPPPRRKAAASSLFSPIRHTAREAGVSESALQAARLVLEAVDPLRYLARIQRLLDVAVTIVRLRALERFGQPLDKALEKVSGVAHLLLRRRMEGPATTGCCATVAHTVQIGISARAL